jgi:lipopolysaccharide/colanic/teichoic acid biosynthesis glycosyltransferase
VSGGDAVQSSDKRLKFDLDYLDHRSLQLAMKIIPKNFPVIFRAGAYEGSNLLYSQLKNH